MAKNNSANGKRAPQQSSNGVKIFIVVLSFINLVLSIVSAVLNRRETLRAIEDDEATQVLLTVKPEKHDL